jgi:cell division protein ZapB
MLLFWQNSPFVYQDRRYPIDPDKLPLYIHVMTTEKPTQTIDIELKKLEHRVDELIHICNRLTEENRSLRHQHDTLKSDRNLLMQKNEQVKSRVEAMITRLKSMEKHP